MCCLSAPAMASASLKPSLMSFTVSIAVKELISVVLAAALFGHQWMGKVVQFVVDNKAVVDFLMSHFAVIHI